MGNMQATGSGIRHGGHHHSDHHEGHSGHSNHDQEDGQHDHGERMAVKERALEAAEALEARTKETIRHGRERMEQANDYAMTKADQLGHKTKEVIEQTMSDDNHNANRSYQGGQSGRDGEWQPARQRVIEASEQMESKAKSLIREGRDRANHASDEAMIAAERLGGRTRDGISRTLPATSRQDEDLLKKAVANKGALMAAGGGLAMALVLGLNKKGKKRAMWPLVVFPAVGFAIGTAYQANKTSKAIASSSSDSDFANQIRNIRNGNKPVEGHKTTTHLGHGPDGRKTV